MADVSVRIARPEDAEHVAHVQLTTWQTAYAELLPEDALRLPLDQVAAVWLNAIESPPSAQHRVLVALDGPTVVGFSASEPVEDATELTAFVVDPRWGRKGHGSRLLAATVDHWRADGVEVGVHWVFEQDAVVNTFLEAAGWGPEQVQRTLDTGVGLVQQRRWHTSL